MRGEEATCICRAKSRARAQRGVFLLLRARARACARARCLHSEQDKEEGRRKRRHGHRLGLGHGAARCPRGGPHDIQVSLLSFFPLMLFRYTWLSLSTMPPVLSTFMKLPAFRVDSFQCNRSLPLP